MEFFTELVPIEAKVEMIKVTVIEPTALVREGIKNVFQNAEDFQLSAFDSLEAVSETQTELSSVYLVNLNAFSKDKIFKFIKKFENKGRSVVCYSSDKGRESHLNAEKIMNAKLGGIILDAKPEQILFAAREVHSGETYFCQTSQEIINDKKPSPTSSLKNRSLLTLRETEILSHLASGESNREVAKQLKISVRTVETHRSRIMSKLNARSFADLVRFALVNKVVN